MRPGGQRKARAEYHFRTAFLHSFHVHHFISRSRSVPAAGVPPSLGLACGAQAVLLTWPHACPGPHGVCRTSLRCINAQLQRAWYFFGFVRLGSRFSLLSWLLYIVGRVFVLLFNYCRSNGSTFVRDNQSGRYKLVCWMLCISSSFSIAAALASIFPLPLEKKERLP